MISPSTKRRARRRRLLTVFSLLVILSVIGVVYFCNALGPAQPEMTAEKTFIVRNGATPGEIAHNLQQEGLIKNASVFLLYARLSGNLLKFKAGEYLLAPAFPVARIMEMLTKGQVSTVTFTVPEGRNLREIAKILEEQGIMGTEEFWRLVKEGDYSYPFLEGLPRDEHCLEGYLFPDTYKIPKGMVPEKVLDMMLARFEQIAERLPANQSGLTARQAVILASLVEGESKVDKDRPLIASVFLNRLRINMKLDSDATVQYLFDEHKERVLYKDLEIDSPYNTYRYRGLPPGPIGSPGEASLRAVWEPADTNYLYFVAKKDGSGEHVFTRTLAEHNRAKKELGY